MENKSYFIMFKKHNFDPNELLELSEVFGSLSESIEPTFEIETEGLENCVKIVNMLKNESDFELCSIIEAEQHIVPNTGSNIYLKHRVVPFDELA